MIQLTRLNGQKFTLNAVLIEQVESLPDTTISLINGKKILVKNSQSEVIQLITAFYKDIGLQRIQNKVGEGSEQTSKIND